MFTVAAESCLTLKVRHHMHDTPFRILKDDGDDNYLLQSMCNLHNNGELMTWTRYIVPLSVGAYRLIFSLEAAMSHAAFNVDIDDIQLHENTLCENVGKYKLSIVNSFFLAHLQLLKVNFCYHFLPAARLSLR